MSKIVSLLAYRQGRQARVKGERLVDNPYRFMLHRPWLSLDWRKGYDYESELLTGRDEKKGARK